VYQQTKPQQQIALKPYKDTLSHQEVVPPQLAQQQVPHAQVVALQVNIY